MGVLIRDLGALYAAARTGRPAPLPPLAVQYADFALWQRERLRGEVLASQLAWWRERLAGAPAVLDLPMDRPRPAVRSRRGGVVPAPVPAAVAAGLRAVGQRTGATLFMTLLAAFQALLARYAGVEAPVGSPIAGRNQKALEDLIGFFVNTLVLRTGMAGDPTFTELAGRAREAILGAYAHQEVPFEKLVEELAPYRDTSYSPLFQVMLALQNAPQPAVDLAGLRIETLEGAGSTAKFDLTVTFAETADGLGGSLEYSLDVFDPATAGRIVRHFQTLLAGAAADPGRRLSELPLLDETERAQLLDRWNATATAYPREATVPGLFRLQADRRPKAPALDFGGEVVTYGELAARASQVAGYLQSLGVRRGDHVGVSLERSPELIVCLLAVLEAGAAYVPLDPTYPADRLAFMAEDSGAGVVLTREEPGPAARPVPLGADDIAYVMYTSGSTGRPKGVAIPHRGIVRLVVGTRYVALAPSERVGHISNIAFDAATFEIWGALLNGACLVGMEREVALAPARLAAEVKERGITTLFLTTALFQQVAREAPETFRGLRNVFFGGEACDPGLVRQSLERGAPERLLHVYGPTENTTYATWHLVSSVPDGAVTVPIGAPISNSTAYVVGPDLNLCPVGVPGELLVGGDGLAQGYWNRPDLTAEKFVPNPFGEAGSRLYRTGDLVRWLPEGAIEFLGRIDQQVKVRGFRIEPGEIEAALLAHSGVSAAVVQVWEPSPGDRRLAAWVVGETDGLRAFLEERLPSYMVPAAFVSLPALPLTPNGKVDRKALPAPVAADFGGEGFVAPRTPEEEILAGIWRDLLGVGDVGVYDDFFELGGHSLLATRLASRLRTAFGVELPIRQLFETPTLAALAAAVQEARRVDVPPVVPVPRDSSLPLSFAQERMWFLEQLEPGRSTYIMPSSLRLLGSLRADLLERALNEVARRHETLRTTFGAVDGRPFQEIRPELALAIPVVDLQGVFDREAEAERINAIEVRRPFDLARGPLLRVTLLRLAAEDHLCLLQVHHSIADAWSLGRLMDELTRLYIAFSRGEAAPLPPLPVQYADFAVWQRGPVGERLFAEQTAYWRERLAAPLPVLDLPTDRPRPAVRTFQGAVVPGQLSRELTADLKALSRRSGATLFMTLLAGLSTLLSRTSGQEDVLIGSPIAGRNRPEIEGLIGCFLNTVVLRADLAGDPSFLELLARVREATLGAYAHQDLPFEKLLEEVRPERDLSRTPLFQVFLNMVNVPGSDSPSAGPGDAAGAGRLGAVELRPHPLCRRG